MAHADLLKLYVVITIIFMVEKSQGGENILVRVFSTLGVKGSLFFWD